MKLNIKYKIKRKERRRLFLNDKINNKDIKEPQNAYTETRILGLIVLGYLY